MISSPVIKAFYDGIGVARNAEHGVRGMQKQSVCYVSQEFYLPHYDSKRFKQIEHAMIDRFVFLSNKWGNDVNHLDSFTFVPTDKDGNHDPFEIVKGQDIYRHENGNALRLIFDDDAPPAQQDTEPTEKPLSESERTTLLKMIYGMAIDGYGFNPKEKNTKFTGQTSEGLAAHLQGAGIDVSYKSVKKYIDMAKELLEPERKS